MGARGLEGLCRRARNCRRNGPQAGHLRTVGCHVDERGADDLVVAVGGRVTIVRLAEPASMHRSMTTAIDSSDGSGETSEPPRDLTSN